MAVLLITFRRLAVLLPWSRAESGTGKDGDEGEGGGKGNLHSPDLAQAEKHSPLQEQPVIPQMRRSSPGKLSDQPSISIQSIRITLHFSSTCESLNTNEFVLRNSVAIRMLSRVCK